MSIFKGYPILIIIGVFFVFFLVFAYRFKSEIVYFIRYLIKKFRKKHTRKGKWSNKKWLVIGDSLSDITTSYTNMLYCDYIAKEKGIKVINKARRGTGYAKRLKLKNSFYLKTLNISKNADVITVFGSFNDFTAGLPLGQAEDEGFESLAGYINATLDNILRFNPKAKLGVITPTPWSAYNPVSADDSTKTIANSYVDLLIEICKLRSVACLDLYYNSLLKPWDAEFRKKYYSKDSDQKGGVHPNEEGHFLIAKEVSNFLESLLEAFACT